MDNLLAFIAALFTAFFGVLAMIKPQLVAKIASIAPKGKTGISEIRAVYGGWIFGLAAYALYSQSLDAYACLGFGWLGAAVLRITSIFIDKSYAPKNLRMVACELLVAMLFLISINL
ncbi:MAG: DUF4345 family protein [Chitinophagales bacterium]|nr:DUF4345 family protein [Chitinophagales bacterium]